MDNENTNGWPDTYYEIRQKDMGVAILSKKTPINKKIYNFIRALNSSFIWKQWHNRPAVHLEKVLTKLVFFWILETFPIQMYKPQWKYVKQVAKGLGQGLGFNSFG
jgi:hypothetical protein